MEKKQRRRRSVVSAQKTDRGSEGDERDMRGAREGRLKNRMRWEKRLRAERES